MTLSLEGSKVVSSQEMARIEALAYADGFKELDFMQNAGEAIATRVQFFIEVHDLPQVVTLLVGKGNNGGDAFAAGYNLIERGLKVVALHIYPLESCSPLCKQMREKFQACGGKIKDVNDAKSIPIEEDGIILDGLVGTGFKGKVEGILALAIKSANESNLPILAIDIPSGLNGSTGDVESVAIKAKETIFLGLPKMGFFLKQGWDHVGTLRHANFGLEDKYILSANPLAYVMNEEAPSSLLPPLKRTRHKYQAGYVLAVAGSHGMPGAALLASYAALRSGAGIVRLFHQDGIEGELHSAPFELIRQDWNLKAICHEAERAKAMLIGPGMGRTKKTKRCIEQLLKSITLPMVVDADALFFLAENCSWNFPKGSVLTPHVGEMNLILTKCGYRDVKKTNLELCQQFAEEKQATIVLKGAPTFIFHPKTSPLIITRGDPGMATAGSGDVLTGMIAAMIAQGLEARRAAALAVYLHGLSGELAASCLTSYCMTASDLIEFLPEAFQDALLGG